MKHLLSVFLLLSFFAIAQENFIPSIQFRPEDMAANGLPKEWRTQTPGAKFTFNNGAITLENKDDKQATLVCSLNKSTEPNVTYIFSYKVTAAETTQVRVYIESVFKDAGGGQHWTGTSAAPFIVGPEGVVRKASFHKREDFLSSYIAFISVSGKPVTISDIMLRKAHVRTELGGTWDLEEQVEVVDNGVIVTKGKPATLSGIPVQPGKTYRLAYNTIGIGDTGNDYPFHEITVHAKPQGIKGNYFFNDVRNDQVQPKFQRITIPENSSITKIDLTFSANTKGRVHFYDFEFGEFVPDPIETWRLFLDEPFYRDIIFESTDAGRIAGQIAATAPAASADIDINGVGNASIQLTDGKGAFSIAAKNLPMGKYKLVCQVKDETGKVLKTFERMIAKVPKAPMEILCAPDRYFRINGKPFFPVTQWKMSFDKDTYEASVYQSARNGINSTISGVSKNIPERLKYLDMMNKYGIKVIFSGGAAKSLAPSELERFKKQLETYFPKEMREHPAFFGYFMIDEPLWGGKPYSPLAASLEIYKEFDPYHPVWINAAPRNEVEDLIPYGEACDIYGVDIYPIPSPNSHSGLDDKGITSVGKYSARMSDITFWRKPTWMALQGFAWAAFSRNPDPSMHIYPDDTQMRFMAFDMLLNGGTGFGLWGTHYVKRASFYDTIHKTTRELHTLSGLFIHGKQLADIASGNENVRIVPIKRDNAFYYAVVNLSSDKEAECAFEPLAPAQSFTVYATGATITPAAGKISLSLKPLEVILFGSAPLPAPVYELPTRNEELEKVDGGNPIGKYCDAIAEKYMNLTPYKGTAKWLWDKTPASEACTWLATDFTIPADAKQVIIKIAADDYAFIYVNGKTLGKASSYDIMHLFDATTLCKPNKNTLLIKGIDGGAAPCGVLAEIVVDGKLIKISDETWLAKETTAKSDLPKSLEDFKPAFVVAPYGKGAWGTKVCEKKQIVKPEAE